MRINFGVMSSLGDEVMRPFLQDVVKFGSLGKTLVTMTTRDPMFVPQILIQAGPAQSLTGSATSLRRAYDLAAGIAVFNHRAGLQGAHGTALAGSSSKRPGTVRRRDRRRTLRGISRCWTSGKSSCCGGRSRRGSGAAGETTTISTRDVVYK